MAIHSTAMVDKKSEIDSSVEIGANVVIEEGVTIHKDVRIMPNVYIFKGTEIGEGTVIHPGAVIGNEPQDLAYKGAETFTRIGKNNVIREYVTIHRGTEEGSATVVGDNNYLMVQMHIGHNGHIEDNVIVAPGALIAGHVHVEKGVFISGNVVVHQFCRVGAYAMIGGFSGVNKDVPPYVIIRGPSIVRGINVVGLRRAGFGREAIREIKDAFKRYYMSNRLKEEAIKEIKDTLHSDEVSYFVNFIENSKRGISRARLSKDILYDE